MYYPGYYFNYLDEYYFYEYYFYEYYYDDPPYDDNYTGAKILPYFIL